MNIWEIDKVFLFLVMVLPGFISLNVYDLLIASEKRDFSKSIVEAICFSVLNFVVLSLLLIHISSNNFVGEHPIQYWLSMIFIFIVMPAIWPFIYIKITKLKIFKRHILSPYKQPWDYVFSKKESLWVVLHLQNGNKIRGKYGKKSFTSSYPSERQIYLEELWKADDKGGFKSKVPRTEGVLVSQDEIVRIELYK
ncbi:MAG: hypothetical protein DRQ44_06535 [Gammaproteobacteria bacterium]|nr:MAG: hypothetical protein DRQ44_06535 [Gammaproteobacteria bacterium]